MYIKEKWDGFSTLFVSYHLTHKGSLQMSSQTHIVQATSLPETQHRWTLSLLDKQTMRMNIRGTWIYRDAPSPDALRESLASLLSYYPHLTGRMVDTSYIEYTNAGVPFTTTQNHSISLKDIEEDQEIVDKLAPTLNAKQVQKGQQAPLQVQLTEIKDAHVLSVIVNHGMMDGNSFYSMMLRWSRLHRGLEIIPPVLDTSLLPQASDVDKDVLTEQAKELGWRPFSLWKLLWHLPSLIISMRAKRFGPIYWSPENLHMLKQKAIEQSGCQTINTHEALSSYLSLLFSQRGKKKSNTYTQSVVIDGRGRLEDVPENYVGNISYVIPGATFNREDSFGTVAQKMHDAVKPYLSYPSKKLTFAMKASLQAVQEKLPLMPFDIVGANITPPREFYINNFSKFPVYDVCFGSAQSELVPIRVVPHNLPDLIQFWPTPPAQGGIEVYLNGPLANIMRKHKPTILPEETT